MYTTRNAAWTFDAGEAAWMALEAIPAWGGNGYASELPAGRRLRDVPFHRIGADTVDAGALLHGCTPFGQVAWS